ncbi:hypothetical protein DFH09DRAFT_1076873 [Mycena vulgaris]|nr:hypothetical protein DFH09DRAFT_1076873 [Mycena vulgaris]
MARLLKKAGPELKRAVDVFVKTHPGHVHTFSCLLPTLLGFLVPGGPCHCTSTMTCTTSPFSASDVWKTTNGKIEMRRLASQTSKGSLDCLIVRDDPYTASQTFNDSFQDAAWPPRAPRPSSPDDSPTRHEFFLRPPETLQGRSSLISGTTVRYSSPETQCRCQVLALELDVDIFAATASTFTAYPPPIQGRAPTRSTGFVTSRDRLDVSDVTRHSVEAFGRGVLYTISEAVAIDAPPAYLAAANTSSTVAQSPRSRAPRRTRTQRRHQGSAAETSERGRRGVGLVGGRRAAPCLLESEGQRSGVDLYLVDLPVEGRRRGHPARSDGAYLAARNTIVSRALAPWAVCTSCVCCCGGVGSGMQLYPTMCNDASKGDDGAIARAATTMPRIHPFGGIGPPQLSANHLSSRGGRRRAHLVKICTAQIRLSPEWRGFPTSLCPHRLRTSTTSEAPMLTIPVLPASFDQAAFSAARNAPPTSAARCGVRCTPPRLELRTYFLFCLATRSAALADPRRHAGGEGERGPARARRMQLRPSSAPPESSIAQGVAHPVFLVTLVEIYILTPRPPFSTAVSPLPVKRPPR